MVVLVNVTVPSGYSVKFCQLDDKATFRLREPEEMVLVVELSATRVEPFSTVKAMAAAVLRL